MKTIAFKITAVACFVAALCAHAAAQAPTSQTPQAALPQTSVGAGTVNGSTYTSDYFGMSLTIPAGWSVYDARGRQMILDSGRHALNAPDKATQDSLEATLAQSINLLTISKLPQEQSGPGNAIFACGAERLAGTGIKTGTEYLLAMKKLLQYATPPAPQVEEDVSSEAVGGVEFGVLTLRYEGPGGAIRQKYWATQKRDYAVFCISTYTNEDDRQLMSRAMSSIKFQ
ncbi:MAG TPA: hypothetical protein VLJ61_02360 [Pyrinomonadaceae bacterium]|nr:hypothetical protein [Pyrinomonadaceae bacterium]